MHPPLRVVTPRLVLRCWRVEDAEALKSAIDASLPELQRWIPWAAHEPSAVAEVGDRLRRLRAGFESGPDWEFGIFDRAESRVLGSAGLHDRLGPGALEIGYWIRSDAAGQGFATEAATAVTAVGMQMGARHIEAHTDPANAASIRVAVKLGYQHAVTRAQDYVMPDGRRCDTMVWVWPPGATACRPRAGT